MKAQKVVAGIGQWTFVAIGLFFAWQAVRLSVVDGHLYLCFTPAALVPLGVLALTSVCWVKAAMTYQKGWVTGAIVGMVLLAFTGARTLLALGMWITTFIYKVW